MRIAKLLAISLILVLSFLLTVPAFEVSASPLGATAPGLGAAGAYSVLGGAQVTDTGSSTFNRNVSFPSTGIIASQTQGHLDTAVNSGALAAASTAYGKLAAQALTGTINLGTNQIVAPGVYDVAATTFTGNTITLNGGGVYIFRSTSSITDPGSSTIALTNGARACDVFWQIPTSMSIGTGTTMVGTILAQTGSITIANGATVNGRALAFNPGVGQVTLDNDTFIGPTCARRTSGGGSGGGGGGSAAPTSAPIATSTPIGGPTATPTLVGTGLPPELPPTGGGAPDEPPMGWGGVALGAVGLTMSGGLTLWVVTRKRKPLP